jgi:hypothetical protein
MSSLLHDELLGNRSASEDQSPSFSSSNFQLTNSEQTYWSLNSEYDLAGGRAVASIEDVGMLL